MADYRNASLFVGQRVVVVGGGNSAVQVAHELAEVATVTLATLRPIRFTPQRVAVFDVHTILRGSRLDGLPGRVARRLLRGSPVLDPGIYRRALAGGRMHRRGMFHRLTAQGVEWSDGGREPVDTVLLATGYRPALPYLADMGALSPEGMPLHRGGLSTTHRGLGYLGLEFQRTFASNTLRGVHDDARFVVRRLKGAGS